MKTLGKSYPTPHQRIEKLLHIVTTVCLQKQLAMVFLTSLTTDILLVGLSVVGKSATVMPNNDAVLAILGCCHAGIGKVTESPE
jgi:hypothetical protein